MSDKQQKPHLPEEWRTMVIDAVEHGMTVTWERDPIEGDYLEIMHPAQVACHVTTRAELDEFLSEWSSPWDDENE